MVLGSHCPVGGVILLPWVSMITTGNPVSQKLLTVSLTAGLDTSSAFMASVIMMANSVCKSFFILFVLELLGDFDQEVGDVANIGEAAVDLHIDIFWLVMGVCRRGAWWR